MTKFHSVYKLIILILFFLLGGIIFTCYAPIFFCTYFLYRLTDYLFPQVLSQEKHFLRIFLYQIIQNGVAFYLRLTNLKFSQICLQELYQLEKSSRPFIIVSNHRSHLDMFIYLAYVSKVRAMANAYLMKVPILNLIMKISGHFIIRPGDYSSYQKAMNKITSALQICDHVLIFPEVTRRKAELPGIGKFHLTAFQLAKKLNVPILPLVLQGTEAIWPKGKLGADFSHSLSLTALKPIDPQNFVDTETLMKNVHRLMEIEYNSKIKL